MDNNSSPNMVEENGPKKVVPKFNLTVVFSTVQI